MVSILCQFFMVNFSFSTLVIASLPFQSIYAGLKGIQHRRVYHLHRWPAGRFKPLAGESSTSIFIDWNWICLEDRPMLARLLLSLPVWSDSPHHHLKYNHPKRYRKPAALCRVPSPLPKAHENHSRNPRLRSDSPTDITVIYTYKYLSQKQLTPALMKLLGWGMTTKQNLQTGRLRIWIDDYWKQFNSIWQLQICALSHMHELS